MAKQPPATRRRDPEPRDPSVVQLGPGATTCILIVADELVRAEVCRERSDSAYGELLRKIRERLGLKDTEADIQGISSLRDIEDLLHSNPHKYTHGVSALLVVGPTTDSRDLSEWPAGPQQLDALFQIERPAILAVAVQRKRARQALSRSLRGTKTDVGGAALVELSRKSLEKYAVFLKLQSDLTVYTFRRPKARGPEPPSFGCTVEETTEPTPTPSESPPQGLHETRTTLLSTDEGPREGDLRRKVEGLGLNIEGAQRDEKIEQLVKECESMGLEALVEDELFRQIVEDVQEGMRMTPAPPPSPPGSPSWAATPTDKPRAAARSIDGVESMPVLVQRPSVHTQRPMDKVYAREGWDITSQIEERTLTHTSSEGRAEEASESDTQARRKESLRLRQLKVQRLTQYLNEPGARRETEPIDLQVGASQLGMNRLRVCHEAGDLLEEVRKRSKDSCKWVAHTALPTKTGEVFHFAAKGRPMWKGTLGAWCKLGEHDAQTTAKQTGMTVDEQRSVFQSWVDGYLNHNVTAEYGAVGDYTEEVKAKWNQRGYEWEPAIQRMAFIERWRAKPDGSFQKLSRKTYKEAQEKEEAGITKSSKRALLEAIDKHEKEVRRFNKGRDAIEEAYQQFLSKTKGEVGRSEVQIAGLRTHVEFNGQWGIAISRNSQRISVRIKPKGREALILRVRPHNLVAVRQPRAQTTLLSEIGKQGEPATPKEGETDKIAIDFGQGRFTPAELLGVQILATGGQRHHIKATQVTGLDFRQIGDTGAGIGLIGAHTVKELETSGPALVEWEDVDKDRQRWDIRGVGGDSEVCGHVRLSIGIGGEVIHLRQVPVLKGLAGLILGNEFNVDRQANYEYKKYTHKVYGEVDGTLTISGQSRRVEVPFRCQDNDSGYLTGLAEATAHHTNQKEAKDKTEVYPFQEAIVEPLSSIKAREGAYDKKGEADEAEQPLSHHDEVVGLRPLAYCSKGTLIPAWSEKIIYARVPKVVSGDHDVLITPLEGLGHQESGVIIRPTLVRPTKEGYVPIGCINPSTKPMKVPTLMPLAHFVVDPRVDEAAVQYTVEQIMEATHIAEALSGKQKQGVSDVLKHVRRLFSSELGWAHGCRMRIETPEIDKGLKAPPASPPRRRSPEELEQMLVLVKKMLMEGLIEPALSPFAAEPVLVAKPDGTKRLTIDWRNLNLLTTKDAYPLPSMTGNLEKLGKAKYYTTLDLLQGFHQIELEPESAKKTAFNTPFGSYQYLRMPMGLCTSPANFMRVVDAALEGLPPGIAVAYMDDIIIPSETWEQHLIDIQLVMERLIAAGFTARCDKVYIGQSEVKYLGFICGNYGTRVDPEKTKPIAELTVEHLKEDGKLAAKWLGACGFYARFIPGFHDKAAPFHNLKIQGVNTTELMRSLRFKASFATLRNALVSATALSRPDYSKPFVLEVDAATSTGCGACLGQWVEGEEQREGNVRPIAFMSHKFNDVEKGWSTFDLEGYGLYLGVKEHRPYIWSSKCYVYVDHKAHQWLTTAKHKEGSRVNRWALELQGYDLEIRYQPGKYQIVSDAISRLVGKEGEQTHSNARETLAASTAKGEKNRGGSSESRSLPTKKGNLRCIHGCT